MSKSQELIAAQRAMQKEINDKQLTREELEEIHGKGKVWDTKEMQEAFHVKAFSAPFCGVTRKSDGKEGILYFQHVPRFYYGFEEE